MTVTALLIVALSFFAYAMVSARLSRWAITAPIVFVAFGWLTDIAGLFESGFDGGSVEILAEATLVLVLFSDATRIDLAVLRRQIELPARLLAIGLPLSILLGGWFAGLLIDGITGVEGFLIGAILAPTDAALGQAVVSNPVVPGRIRQALNVESGLNDGIALPVVAALAVVAAGSGVELGTGSAISSAGGDILFGVLIGAGVGALAGIVLRKASSRGMVEGIARQLATLSVPAIAFGVTHATLGNGFIAAFVAGIAFGHAAREVCEASSEFAEDQAQLLTWATFFLFGAALIGPALDSVTWQIGLYAVISLTIVRFIPVAIAVLGSGLMSRTVLFLGWFGPRGLASILFALLILDEGAAGHETVLHVVTITVLASVVLHGITARPLAMRYGAHEMDDDMPEAVEVEEMRSAGRGGLSQRES